MHWIRTTAVIIATSSFLATVAFALPRVDTPVPNATVRTLDGKTFDTRSTQGRVTVVFYEDKDATAQNKALKDALKAQTKQKTRKANADVYAVADVSAWNFWPAKGYVKDAIEAQEKASGHPIYCDWSGEFGKALGTVANKSNVVLIGPDRRVMVANAGVLSAATRERIVRETAR